MNPALLVALGLGAWALWPRNASASVPQTPREPLNPGAGFDFGDWLGSDYLPGVPIDPELFYEPEPDDPSWLDAWSWDQPFQPEWTDDMQPLRAFLYLIRRSEHSGMDVLNGVDYSTFYGVTRFTSFADHPVLTGELQGVPLPDHYCRAAGFSPGCVSTAAGAYQINKPTWMRIRARHPRLPDFSPQSQDEAALRLIAEKGATSLIRQGRIEEAVYKVAPVWASLPRSTSQQPQRTIDEVLAFYGEGLRNVA